MPRILLLLILLLLNPIAALSAIICVPEDYTTIHEAVSETAFGDTISLAYGLHQVDASISVGSSVTIAGRGLIDQSDVLTNVLWVGPDDGNLVFCDADSSANMVRFSTLLLDGSWFRFARNNGLLDTLAFEYCEMNAGTIAPFVGMQNLELMDCSLQSWSIGNNYAPLEIAATSSIVIRNSKIFGWTTNPQHTGQWSRLTINSAGILVVENTVISTFMEDQAVHLVCDNGLFRNNIITECRQAGIYGLVQFSGELQVVNNIIWGNDYGSYYCHISAGNGAEFAYNCIDEGLEAFCSGGFYEYSEGNIQIDPLFDLQDYSLSPDSPCIDAGDPNSPPDPDGTIADMGAFYFCQGEEISLPEEHRLTAEPGYPEQFTIDLTSACDPVQIDSARTMTADFNLIASPDVVEGEFQTGQFQIAFSPASQGVYTDTLHIWADTEFSNTEDPRHHVVPLIGEAGPIPAPVRDLSISILEDLSAQLTWSPVDTTIYGNPVTPDWYLVFYNELDPLVDDYWYYQGAVAGSEYTHFLAAQFADIMNYRVVAWKGIYPAALGLNQGSSYETFRHVLKSNCL